MSGEAGQTGHPEQSGQSAQSGRAPSTAGRRRVVVLRHGQTGHNAAGIWQGQLDSDLSDLGREQARAAGKALAALAPSVVVASDLTRAAHTGAEVASAAGVELALDRRWREIDVGRWEGLTAEEVLTQYPQERERHFRGEDFPRGVDGESLSDVTARVRAALDDLLRRLGPGETAVVATHGVTGRVVAAALVGLDVATVWRVLGGFGNCHWAEVVEGPGGWRISAWNTSA